MSFLIARRVLTALVTLSIVSLMIFFCTELLPGDAAQALLGQTATPESLNALREQLGLNLPAATRYWTWISGILHGDLGVSITNGVPVVDLVRDPLFNTLRLAAIAAVVSIPLALSLGLISVLHAGTKIDRAINVGALCAVSVPEFFVAALLTFVFSVQLGWLPSIAFVRPHQSVWEQARSLILPTSVLTLVVLAHMVRMTRTAILNVLSSAYVETAILKGMKRRDIVLWHALPNAVAPILNVIAVVLAYLVAGVVVVETIFAYPGLGRLMVESVAVRDVPLIQACGLIFCSVYFLANLLADIVSMVSNPRLRRRP
ncbi:ABC transporter permease [Mesorhizobium sp.]|uniref:ABC transporter permease n=1 Tax=Mesorhizobium sp. TaxID=1871066 RepID=UPI000FE9E078|nr:ABC transporter permease [Mesorhizobium sp.]RWI16493.1 MAG: ABC transporter permease [Mesorhizobium sp.]RWN06279.1 MAG: ABC transporter permease [Mesorhizobium sp.]RWN08242.1 MAG: ABC transporter permease [Mesorhizobium sp.]TIQ97611.1 MAG: ABC transporter permease [Mesorhizobium sp.]